MILRTGASRTDERGIALVLALFAMVVIGGLVGSSFFVARLEQQSGQNTLFAAQASEAAEMGLRDALATMPPLTVESIAVGEPLPLDTLILENGVTVSRQVTRLTSGLFLIHSHGLRQTGTGQVLATRSLGVMVEVTETGLHPIERGWVQLY
jgi:hypothetical protein